MRVPPVAAIQCIQDGPNHRRGTPPNAIEMAPNTWLELFLGKITFAQGVETGLIDASGANIDLFAQAITELAAERESAQVSSLEKTPAAK